MKKLLIFPIIAFVIMLSFTPTGFALYASTDPWSMYRHDIAHSGVTPSNAPSSSNNNTRWVYTVSAGGLSIVATPLIFDGRVIFQVTDRVFAVDETNGIQLWSYQATGWLTAPTYADGRVFVGSGITDYNGGLICINASTGAEIWKKDLTTNYVKGTPLVSKGIVYAGVAGNYTYAFEAATGHFKWQYKTDGPVYSSPAADGDIVFFGSDKGTLYALNVSGPMPVQTWNFTANGAIRSPPSINGDRVFFGSDNNKLYAINKTTGKLIWTWATATPSAKIQNGVSVANNIVYVTSMDVAKVYALYADAAPGNYTDPDFAISYWTKDLSSDGVGGLNEPVYAGGKIIVTGTGGSASHLYALDADVGNILWIHRRGWWSAVGSAVVADGRVWYSVYYSDPSYNLLLYCLGPTFPPTTYSYTVNAGGHSFNVEMETNSTITDFSTANLETQGKISFKAKGIGTTGMCNITLPMDMIDGLYNVTVDGGQPIYSAPTMNNGTHAWLYFTYNTTSQHTIVISGSTFVPEFQPITIAPMMAAILFMVLLKSKKIAKLH
jgi:outer membrane protein assembly factor BamB